MLAGLLTEADGLTCSQLSLSLVSWSGRKPSSGGSVALTAFGHDAPTGAASSCGKTEELVHQTDFAYHTRMPQHAVTSANHSHHLKALQGRRGGLHLLESAGRPDHPLEGTVNLTK